MSCASKNSFPLKRPKPTKTMIRKNQDYVWKEVEGNPNLYCWIPVSKKHLNFKKIDISQVNIQDVPEPPYFEDAIVQLAKEAITKRNKILASHIAKKNNNDVNMVSYDDPKKYKIVRDFLSRKGLKVYGGIAINSYLPKEYKIYGSKEIPDFDFFSPDPWDDAIELADDFYKAGYKYVEAKGGIHKGTYKVYVNLWPVADITHLPRDDFNRLDTITIGGIKIVSPFKLLESMYKEFSEPYSNPDRWPKVAARQKLLQKTSKYFKDKTKCSPDIFTGGIVNLQPIRVELLKASYKYFKSQKILFSGPLAYNTYIAIGGGDKRVLEDLYRVLSMDAKQDVLNLFNILVKIYKNIEISTEVHYRKELNNTSYYIYVVFQDLKYYPICEIIQLSSCTPYQKIQGLNIVSIDYLMYELYDMATFLDRDVSEDIKCLIKYLLQIQYSYYKTKKITELDDSPFRRFITDCKGPFRHNIKTEILNRWIERVNNKDKIIKRWTPTHKIREYPKEDIPLQCKNVEKENCKYPCFWNKYIGKCQGISKGIYRPEEQKDSDIYNEYLFED